MKPATATKQTTGLQPEIVPSMSEEVEPMRLSGVGSRRWLRLQRGTEAAHGLFSAGFLQDSARPFLRVFC